MISVFLQLIGAIALLFLALRAIDYLFELHRSGAHDWTSDGNRYKILRNIQPVRYQDSIYCKRVPVRQARMEGFLSAREKVVRMQGQGRRGA